MDHDISIGFLFKVLKKNWWKLLIVTVAAAILMFAFASLCIPKQYSSTIEFYIININTSYDYTTSSLLGATTQLSNDYISIIKSEYMLVQVREALVAKGYKNMENAPISSLRGMIQSSTSTASSMFSVSVVSPNPDFSYDMACVIEELAPTVVTELAKPDSLTHEGLADKIHTVINYYNNHREEGQNKVDLTEKEISDLLQQGFIGITTKQDCIRPINPPKPATHHDSPNEMVYAVLGGGAALVIAYAILLLRALAERRITTEDDLKRMVNKPFIGAIPHWDASPKK